MESCVGTVRHAFLRGEPVITSKGIVKLDAFGRVVGVATPDGVEVPLGKEDLLQKVPDFLDLAIFPVQAGDQEVAKFTADAASPHKAGPKALEGLDPETLEQIKLVITEMSEDPKNMNSEGKLDMTKLNSSLKSSGLPVVRADVRDALTAG